MMIYYLLLRTRRRVPVTSEVHFIFNISIIYSRIPGICQEVKPLEVKA